LRGYAFCGILIFTWKSELLFHPHIQSMASSSSNPAVSASLSIPASEKLTKDNYRLWRAQVLPAICAAQLEGFIDGSKSVLVKILEVEKDSKKMKVPNPDFAVWRMRDQHVLTYLVTLLSQEVLVGEASAMNSSSVQLSFMKL
jgi:hypothetical protein